MLKRTLLFLICSISMLTAIHAANLPQQLFRDPNSPSAGNPNAPITITEFFDYQCSHCIAMNSTISATIKTHPNVRFVFKEFPLRDGISTFAAKAALAANKQDKYGQFHHMLLSVNQPLTEHLIYSMAESIGINLQKFKQDIKSKAIQNQLTSNINLAKQLHLSGTPAFYIGKTNADDMNQVQFVLGEMSSSSLNTAIQKASL